MTSQQHHMTSEEIAAQEGLPLHVAHPTLLAYRSAGIGVFGAVMRFAGMPLEKIALVLNSSQVSGKAPFRQAVQLTFAEGALAPYRVVGPASLTAWFLQYSVMGVAFQFFDQTLSRALQVRPVYYGKELMEAPKPSSEEQSSMDYNIRYCAARLLSPILAASLESTVSNRAEVQRYFGPTKFAVMEQQLGARSALKRLTGPAFAPNCMRNVIMCQTSFLLTPMAYKFYFPQEHKSKSSLFWFGLSMNIFVGNVMAITQQATWGRSLDYLAQHGRISYRAVVQQGLQRDGLAAFFTPAKWFSRVLMNAPAQGTLPWFYNEILPLGERFAIRSVKNYVYEPFLEEEQLLEEELEFLEQEIIKESTNVLTQEIPQATSPR